MGRTFVGLRKSSINTSESTAPTAARPLHHPRGTHQPRTARAEPRKRAAAVTATKNPATGKPD